MKDIIRVGGHDYGRGREKLPLLAAAHTCAKLSDYMTMPLDHDEIPTLYSSEILNNKSLPSGKIFKVYLCEGGQ